jgi:putative flavoprotein involved in K+ transport
MPERSAEAIVVGGGPGGLAAAAALGRAGIRAVVLEREAAVGASWRNHYDRLHLHTVRWLSGLPGLAIPRRAGPWVSRTAFVEYLEAYVRHHRLDVRTGVEVTALARGGNGGDGSQGFQGFEAWRVSTTAGEWTGPAVVIATGQARVPVLPPWPGMDGFRGRLLHSGRYRSGAEFTGRDVLVVGAGNSGAEIAVDLVEQGAARVRLAVRRGPNVVQRRVAGLVPTQLVSMALLRLPLRAADAVAGAAARLIVGDLTRYGLPAPARGIYTGVVRDRQIPILDAGFLAALRAGRIEIVPAVEGFDGAAVLLRGGGRIEPEIVVAATGFRHGLEGLLGGLGLLGADGVPRVHGAATAPEAPGLHLLGFTVPATGNLREMSRDARRIARAVRARLAARTTPAVPAGAAAAQREARNRSPSSSSVPARGSQT